ncbi:MAG: ABC transporter substrate-binding protein [Treponema sp.]|nr:ABC transporter substrate-binding protein [Treponema sp.]
MQKEKVSVHTLIHRLLLLLVALALVSCTKQREDERGGVIREIDGLSFDHTMPLSYATAFRADVYTAQDDASDTREAFTLLTVRDTDAYLLIPEQHSAPQTLPPDIKPIQLPIKNAYLCASSSMSLVASLGALDALRFSAIQKKDWYIDEAVRAMDAGSLLYAGKYSAPDFERLLDGKCPIAIESMMIYHSPQIREKLESLGITVFIDTASYEAHPLGRLEWIKVYGLLFGKEREAERFFDEQTQKLAVLNQLGANASSAKKKVAFFFVSPLGMVVIRGSDDYIVKMIELAGGTYAFPATKKSTSPSVQISMEQFYAQAGDADILIYNASIDNSIRSKQDLLDKNPLFAEFKAVKSENVWATGKYLYQATDKIGDMILDIHAILDGKSDETRFLERVE